MPTAKRPVRFPVLHEPRVNIFNRIDVVPAPIHLQAQEAGATFSRILTGDDVPARDLLRVLAQRRIRMTGRRRGIPIGSVSRHSQEPLARRGMGLSKTNHLLTGLLQINKHSLNAP
jgi:hypothetical protein